MKVPLFVLLIMDGWGINKRREGNAIKLAKTPNLSRLEKEFPYTELECSGNAVGLPEGLMGNSEVGHLNIGAGRVVWQDITRIDNAIKNGSFFTNPELLVAMEYAHEHKTNLHLIGLVSDGGVHSFDNHYFALLEMAKRNGFNTHNLFFHAVMDGRDTSPTSGVHYLERLSARMNSLSAGRIATICGRYYLMDRDKRWERLEKAYHCLTLGEAVPAGESASDAIKEAYQRGETDEFIKPIVITQDGKPSGLIRDNDSVIFFNFRADRAREITRALTEPSFREFNRKTFPKVFYTTMTQYDENFTLPVAFKPIGLTNILGKVLSQNNIKQLRIAETEKYAHLTYFFNGGEEKPFPLEDRILILSPKVPTYDMQPEMNAPEVTREVLKDISEKRHPVIIMNYANCDMVGHTGILEAGIKAVETVDKSVGEIVDAVLAQKGVIIVTSDHGNAEEMIDYTHSNQPHTYHTTNLVPFMLISDAYKNRQLKPSGKLCDIAPTILEIIGIEKPQEMEGVTLIPHYSQSRPWRD
ncbi:MAG: 2,3-bisphosphoglycerate-independent phosphoglycerate mutase [Planctomycetota bacterium]|nr:2,3-bisphosphoglycerate-independent phosphoglycerate mutase [Planctomycetota bacterium]MDI6787143.1 2,3-bisphosphoglycerate-independent phosphoglycerate mutase [Planctomycetota bacterium]